MSHERKREEFSQPSWNHPPRREQPRRTPWIRKGLVVSPMSLFLFFFMLYAVYVVFHFTTASNNGCNTRMTLLTMFPIRELHTIPMIDRVFAESFTQPSTNPAPALTGAIGMGMKKITTDLLLTPDACLLVQEIFGMQDDAILANPRTDAKRTSASRPSQFLRRFNPHKYGELTRNRVAMYGAISDSAKRVGDCINPPTLSVAAEYRHHYRIYCHGTYGYVKKEHVQLRDGPPAAELVGLSAFLYTRPDLSSKVIAMCHRADIRSITDYIGEFFRVKCERKWGWVETKLIRVPDR